jgi:hypothetical protein
MINPVEEDELCQVRTTMMIVSQQQSPTEAAEEHKEEALTDQHTNPLARFSVGTKVKKFLEGHGWFLGEIRSIYEEYCC